MFRKASVIVVMFAVFSTGLDSSQGQPRSRSSSSAPSEPRSASDAALWRRALAIHRSAIVVDTHNDILSMMTDDNYDLGVSSVGKYHTDFARMKQGGRDG